MTEGSRTLAQVIRDLFTSGKNGVNTLIGKIIDIKETKVKAEDGQEYELLSSHRQPVKGDIAVFVKTVDGLLYALTGISIGSSTSRLLEFLETPVNLKWVFNFGLSNQFGVGLEVSEEAKKTLLEYYSERDTNSAINADTPVEYLPHMDVEFYADTKTVVCHKGIIRPDIELLENAITDVKKLIFVSNDLAEESTMIIPARSSTFNIEAASHCVLNKDEFVARFFRSRYLNLYTGIWIPDKGTQSIKKLHSVTGNTIEICVFASAILSTKEFVTRIDSNNYIFRVDGVVDRIEFRVNGVATDLELVNLISSNVANTQIGGRTSDMVTGVCVRLAVSEIRNVKSDETLFDLPVTRPQIRILRNIKSNSITEVSGARETHAEMLLNNEIKMIESDSDLDSIQIVWLTNGSANATWRPSYYPNGLLRYGSLRDLISEVGSTVGFMYNSHSPTGDDMPESISIVPPWCYAIDIEHTGELKRSIKYEVNIENKFNDNDSSIESLVSNEEVEATSYFKLTGATIGGGTIGCSVQIKMPEYGIAAWEKLHFGVYNNKNYAPHNNISISGKLGLFSGVLGDGKTEFSACLDFVVDIGNFEDIGSTVDFGTEVFVTRILSMAVIGERAVCVLECLKDDTKSLTDEDKARMFKNINGYFAMTTNEVNELRGKAVTLQKGIVVIEGACSSTWQLGTKIKLSNVKKVYIDVELTAESYLYSGALFYKDTNDTTGLFSRNAADFVVPDAFCSVSGSSVLFPFNEIMPVLHVVYGMFYVHTIEETVVLIVCDKSEFGSSKFDLQRLITL